MPRVKNLGEIRFERTFGSSIHLAITLDQPLDCETGGWLIYSSAGICRIFPPDGHGDRMDTSTNDENANRKSLAFGEAISPQLAKVLSLIATLDANSEVRVKLEAANEVFLITGRGDSIKNYTKYLDALLSGLDD